MSAEKIMRGLTEALDWTEGKGSLRVTMPGQPARDMTAETYRARDALVRERADLITRPGGDAEVRRVRIAEIDQALAE